MRDIRRGDIDREKPIIDRNRSAGKRWGGPENFACILPSDMRVYFVESGEQQPGQRRFYRRRSRAQHDNLDYSAVCRRYFRPGVIPAHSK